jgi:hypothetical protein
MTSFAQLPSLPLPKGDYSFLCHHRVEALVTLRLRYLFYINTIEQQFEGKINE